jgi:alkylated DNA repair protein alkB homolog 6
MYYIPSFLSPSKCESLLSNIASTPPQKWTQLSRRRLLSLPSSLTGKARNTLLLASSLPSYLSDGILPGFRNLGIFGESPHRAPNHVLLNEYLPGQGIMPHEDGPAYHPVTATISLGSCTVLDIYLSAQTGQDPTCQKKWRIVQEPGSLLITSGNCYTDTHHGIAEVEVDEAIREETVANWSLLGNRMQFQDEKIVRGLRTSLTYRDVKKVVKM